MIAAVSAVCPATALLRKRAGQTGSPRATTALPAIAGRGASAVSLTEPPHPRARRARPNRTVEQVEHRPSFLPQRTRQTPH